MEMECQQMKSNENEITHISMALPLFHSRRQSKRNNRDFKSRLFWWNVAVDLPKWHSLDQSTIWVIQDPIRCFRNRESQTDGKKKLTTSISNFQIVKYLHSWCGKDIKNQRFLINCGPDSRKATHPRPKLVSSNQ